MTHASCLPGWSKAKQFDRRLNRLPLSGARTRSGGYDISWLRPRFVRPSMRDAIQRARAALRPCPPTGEVMVRSPKPAINGRPWAIAC